MLEVFLRMLGKLPGSSRHNHGRRGRIHQDDHVSFVQMGRHHIGPF